MKKIVRILVVAAAMLLPMATQAQTTTLTVADGTATNSYVPVYGYYADAYLRAQFVYPDTMLSDMAGGGVISQLKFYASTTSVSWGSANFKVYLGSADSTTLSSFVDVSSLTEVYDGSLSVSGGEMVVSLDTPYSYSGGNLMVEVACDETGSYVSCMFYGVNSTGSSIQGYSYSSLSGISPTQRNFLPKVEFTFAPGSGDYCFPVRNLTVSNITDDGFTTSWNTVNGGTLWAVSIDGGATWNNAYDSTYTFSGLNANTPYTVRVVSICTSGDTSAARTVSCRTACGGSTEVPYSENFESLATGEVPNCWNQIQTGSSGSGTFPAAYVYPSNAHNSSVYFEFESSTSQTELVAMPVMDNISSLKLSFYASMSGSYPCTLEVGVMEDTAFVPVDTVALVTFSGTSAWSSNYHQYSVFFNSYSGDGDRIALRATGTGSSQYTLMMDDFIVAVADVPEVSLPASATTDINTDLVVTATVGGDMSSMSYFWSSTMYDAGMATMSDVDNVLTINYTASGIDTITCIASNLYGDDTATMIVHAVDLAPITEYPYSTGFEADDDLNWLFVNGGNAWVIDTAVNNTADGSRSLYISNNGGAGNAYTLSGVDVSYAYRAFQFEETGEYVVSFDWAAVGEGGYDYLRAWVAPSDVEFTAGVLPNGSTSTYSYQTSTPDGWIDLGGKMNQQNTWQNLQTTFPITTPGTYLLVFMWANDVSGGTQPPAAVDNISISQLACPAVADLTLDSINVSEMAFHWHAIGSETEWRVVIGDTIDETVYDTAFYVSELSANTPYTVSVYAICGYDDTSFATTAVYRTACGAISTLPWSEGFEGYTTFMPPTCWNVLGGNPRVMTNVPHNGTQHLFFSGSTSNIIALPPFEAPVNTLQVRLWTRPESSSYSSCGSFSVGYLTDANDTSTFVAVDTWSYNEFSDYEEKEVPFGEAPDSAVCIALRQNAVSSVYYWYVDDLTVETIPTCARPADVSAEATSATDVDVTIAGDSTENYRIYWVAGTTVDSADVSGLTYTITGLDASTNYTINAATICDDGTVSSLVTTSVRTLCADGSCDIEIDMVDSFGDGWNGNAINGFIGTEQVFSATFSSGYNATYTHSICASDTVTLKWYTGSYASETSFTITVGGNEIAGGAGDSYGTGDIIATVAGCPSCSRPSSIVAVATSDSDVNVTLTAIDGGSYRLYWSDGTTVDSADIATLTYTITGLTSSTTYTVSAVTICDDGTISTPIVTTVHTQCVGGGCDMVIDMVDSFGDGWNGNAISGYINGTEAFSATISSGYNGTYTHSICNSDTVVLMWNTGSYANETSFTVTIGGEEIASGAGGDYSDGDTIAIATGCPTCPRPLSIAIDSVSTDQIDFHWVAAGTETSWAVFINDSLVATVGTASYSATGLTHSSTYNIAVRAICAADDTSYAIATVAQTAIVAESVPYSTGFEAGDDIAWITANNANGWFVGNATSMTGTQSLYISNDNGVSNSYSSNTSYSFAYKLFHFTTPGFYGVSFNWQCYGESNFDYLRAFVAPANATITAGSTFSYTGAPTGWESIDGGSRLNLATGWQSQVGAINITTDTTLFVVFAWHNDMSIQNMPPAAIDNIEVSEITCPWPTDFSVDAVDDNTATVSWTATGSETEWAVSLNGGAPVTVYNTSHTFTGLAPSTDYSVTVRAVCGPADSSFALSGSFTTLCGPAALPWSEDFDSIMSFSSLNCWERYSGLYNMSTGTADLVVTTSGWTLTTTAMEGSRHVKLNIYGTSINRWLVTPQINLNVPASLSFDLALTDYYNSDPIEDTSTVADDRFYVLVSTDGGNNWTPVATWGDNTTDYDYMYNAIPSTAESVSVNLGAFTGQTVRIAFYGESTVYGGDNDLHIDNLYVGVGGAFCEMPSFNNMVVTDSEVSFGLVSPADSNEVVIMAGSWVEPDAGTLITTTSHTFSGLTPNTAYTVGIRAVCAEGFYSAWNYVSVTTADLPCLAPNQPTVSNIGYHSADIAWTVNGIEQAWQVRVYNTTFEVLDTVTVQNYTVDGLTPNVTYNVEVSALCGEDYILYSEPSPSASFTTDSCFVPTGVTASGVTANSAVISWTGTGVDKYEVEYGEQGYSTGEGTRVTVTGGATTVTLENLEQQLDYDVFVRAYCDETLYSVWSDVIHFTTAAIGIDDVQLGNVALYPNPASASVTLSGIDGEAMVTIIDLNGREVYRANASGSLTVDVSGYAKGAYFVRVTGERTTAIRKLVVK